jgi:hypothetical protein
MQKSSLVICDNVPGEGSAIAPVMAGSKILCGNLTLADTSGVPTKRMGGRFGACTARGSAERHPAHAAVDQAAAPRGTTPAPTL